MIDIVWQISTYMTIQLPFNDPFGMVTTNDWDQLFSLWMTWIPMVQCWFTIWVRVHRWKCNKMVLYKQKTYIMHLYYMKYTNHHESERFYGKASWRNACSKLKIYKGWKLITAAQQLLGHSSLGTHDVDTIYVTFHVLSHSQLKWREVWSLTDNDKNHKDKNIRCNGHDWRRNTVTVMDYTNAEASLTRYLSEQEHFESKQISRCFSTSTQTNKHRNSIIREYNISFIVVQNLTKYHIIHSSIGDPFFDTVITPWFPPNSHGPIAPSEVPTSHHLMDFFGSNGYQVQIRVSWVNDAYYQNMAKVQIPCNPRHRQKCHGMSWCFSWQIVYYLQQFKGYTV